MDRLGDLRATQNQPGGGKESKKIWFVLAALVLMLIIYALPTPPPLERNGNVIKLTQGGKTCIAILAFTVVLWVTEAVPYAAWYFSIRDMAKADVWMTLIAASCVSISILVFGTLTGSYG